MNEIKERPLFPRKNIVSVIVTSYELEPDGILNPNNKKVYSISGSFDSQNYEKSVEDINRLLGDFKDVVSKNSRE